MKCGDWTRGSGFKYVYCSSETFAISFIQHLLLDSPSSRMRLAMNSVNRRFSSFSLSLLFSTYVLCQKISVPYIFCSHSPFSPRTLPSAISVCLASFPFLANSIKYSYDLLQLESQALPVVCLASFWATALFANCSPAILSNYGCVFHKLYWCLCLLKWKNTYSDKYETCY